MLVVWVWLRLPTGPGAPLFLLSGDAVRLRSLPQGSLGCSAHHAHERIG
jgi:hypothetical protein